MQQGFDWGASAEAAHLSAWPPSLERLSPDWRAVVEPFLASAEGQALSARLQAALDAGVIVYPPEPFRALELTALGPGPW